MHNLGPGCPTGHAGKMDIAMMLLLMMIMCPGMFSGCGDNSLLFLLLIMSMSGGGMF